MMIQPKLLPVLCAGLSIFAALCSPAMAQQSPADRQDTALAFAQCVRDNGYAEFPDPDPEGGFKFLIEPDSVARFKAATAACRDLAPEGMRDEEITPEQLEGLIKLSQCIRENGVSEFPDPTSKGNFDLTGTGIEPGDARLEAAMKTCQPDTGPGQPIRITIGG
jgi:hypothetical protein